MSGVYFLHENTSVRNVSGAACGILGRRIVGGLYKEVSDRAKSQEVQEAEESLFERRIKRRVGSAQDFHDSQCTAHLNSQDKKSVQNCLKEFLSPRPGQGFQCRSCRSVVDSAGECYIMDPPEVLFVNLQHYQQSGRRYVKTREQVKTDKILELDEAVILGMFQN